jgi:hypothetical protein
MERLDTDWLRRAGRREVVGGPGLTVLARLDGQFPLGSER